MRPRGWVRLAAFAGSAVVTPRNQLPALTLRVPTALVGVAALAFLAGCSNTPDSDNLPTRDPATAAVSPAASTRPAGDVMGLSNVRALLTEESTGEIAALDASETSTVLFLIDPTTLTRVGPNGVPDPGVRALSLTARGASLAQGKPGEVLIPAPNRIFRVDIAGRNISEVPVDGDARSVQRRDDGSLLVGTADGKVRTISPEGKLTRTVTGLASADALALTADHVSVLDRRQTSVTEIELGKDDLGLALRAGDGATNMIADRFGRIIVTDTGGGELLVFSAGPLVLRQRFPVNSSPYALAYDQRSDTVWVTCTESNEVVGFDLSTGIPTEVGRYPTVRQPNSVTVDQRTGDMFVGSAADGGLQRIRADDRKRGH
ncbi:YncE family protein [Nocardia sp. CA-128927]|uniref:YncE family protein n=1 Tax=Nocardia sp. CA-128927 TaxID=3239975 RepID=UPI003D952848